MRRFLWFVIFCCVSSVLGGDVLAQTVQKSVFAGSWYPGEPEALSHRLDLYLARTGKMVTVGRPVAMVSPHAGYAYSGQAAAYGFAALKGKGIRRVVIMGASHYHGFAGVAVSTFSAYETPLGKVTVDVAAAKSLLDGQLFKMERVALEKE
ncbi:MAG: AmmeMemoRadiSam system protein B, partial [Elusimicrobiota bacterium]